MDGEHALPQHRWKSGPHGPLNLRTTGPAPECSLLLCWGCVIKAIRSMMLVPQAPGFLSPNATPLHIAAAKGYTHVVCAILHAWVCFLRDWRMQAGPQASPNLLMGHCCSLNRLLSMCICCVCLAPQGMRHLHAVQLPDQSRFCQVLSRTLRKCLLVY